MILIKNARVFSPKALGKKDVLIAFDKILEVADCIEPWRGDLTVIDAAGKMLVPGFIDQHVHIVGGGGEGGFNTRTPEFQLSKAVTSGVTTLVGLLGTDGYTKSPELLLAKTKALNTEGITAYCLTNSYAYPPRTITGSVANDILYISEIIGCKLAITDHRASHPTREELIRLVSDIRMAALVSGKVGELHLHVGAAPEGIEPIMDIVRTTDIPISHFRPTHLGRRPEQVVQFTHMGGYADITASSSVSSFFPGLMETAVPELLTISSDSNGSMPKWDEKHEHIVGMGVGDMGDLYRVIFEMVTQQGVALEKALPFITSNVARALELYPRKGCIAEGSDADLVLLDEGYQIDGMLAKGRIMMQDKQVLVKGTFE